MKLVFAYLLLLLLTRFTAVAQSSEHSTLSTEINDDDKTYSIKIDGDRNGKPVHYNRTFSVAGMSAAQKESLKNRVLDSLGLGEAPPPPTPPGTTLATDPVKVTFVCPTCTGKTKLSISGNGFSAEREVEIEKGKPAFPFALDMPPGTYQYTYWQNKVEQMQLPFTVKAGQENTVKVK
ncbi:MAG: hypothetical protein H7Z72_13415 [Bacteroidetes bacterium]|nr:hypothetical protein [Fibrella sp.]